MSKKITALALVTMLLLAFAPAASAAFVDVPTTHAAKEAIEYCAKYGFIRGRTPTVFDPDATVTRGEFAVIWGRTLQFRMHSFVDVTQTKNEFDNAALLLAGLGHMNGISDFQFDMTSNITREMVASIVARTYLGKQGTDSETYKSFNDGALVSSWARDGVSFCVDNGLFEGIVTTSNLLQPQKPATRAEICMMVFNLMNIEYRITIAPTENGTVVSDHDTAKEGTLITLTVTPEDADTILKSLDYNGTVLVPDENGKATFSMPGSNVTVTAVFTERPALRSLWIEKAPTKLTYTVGDKLNLAGLEVRALYQGMASSTVLSADQYTVDPAGGDTLNTSGQITVTVSYTWGTTTMTDTFTVTVEEAE